MSAWGGNARVGGDELFVVEADEYDKAFLTLHPTVAIVNNVEPDHLECYGSMAALEDAFVEFAGRAETAVVSADDPGRPAASRAGSGAGSAASASPTTPTSGSPTWRSTPTGPRPRSAGAGGRALRVRLRVPGVHNLRNAVAALAAADAIGGDVVRAAAALAEFGGVGRRFERLGEHGGVAVVDDYAHHPSELVGDAGRRAAGLSGAAAGGGVPAAPVFAHRGARRRRWARRWPRPISWSSPRSTPRASSRSTA